jgi:hypothetical protein
MVGGTLDEQAKKRNMTSQPSSSVSVVNAGVGELPHMPATVGET